MGRIWGFAAALVILVVVGNFVEAAPSDDAGMVAKYEYQVAHVVVRREVLGKALTKLCDADQYFANREVINFNSWLAHLRATFTRSQNISNGTAERFLLHLPQPLRRCP